MNQFAKGQRARLLFKRFVLHSVRWQIFFRLFSCVTLVQSVQPFSMFASVCFDGRVEKTELHGCVDRILFSVQFVLNFDFFIDLLDTCGVTMVALYYHFIFASFLHLFFALGSHIATQFACLLGLCCIFVGSMAFTLIWLMHTSARARSQRVNSKTIVESHQISRFMLATIPETEFTHCNGHERLGEIRRAIVQRIHKQQQPSAQHQNGE